MDMTFEEIAMLHMLLAKQSAEIVTLTRHNADLEREVSVLRSNAVQPETNSHTGEIAL